MRQFAFEILIFWYFKLINIRKYSVIKNLKVKYLDIFFWEKYLNGLHDHILALVLRKSRERVGTRGPHNFCSWIHLVQSGPPAKMSHLLSKWLVGSTFQINLKMDFFVLGLLFPDFLLLRRRFPMPRNFGKTRIKESSFLGLWLVPVFSFL